MYVTGIHTAYRGWSTMHNLMGILMSQLGPSPFLQLHTTECLWGIYLNNGRFTIFLPNPRIIFSVEVIVGRLLRLQHVRPERHRWQPSTPQECLHCHGIQRPWPSTSARCRPCHLGTPFGRRIFNHRLVKALFLKNHRKYSDIRKKYCLKFYLCYFIKTQEMYFVDSIIDTFLCSVCHTIRRWHIGQ